MYPPLTQRSGISYVSWMPSKQLEWMVYRLGSGRKAQRSYRTRQPYCLTCLLIVGESPLHGKEQMSPLCLKLALQTWWRIIDLSHRYPSLRNVDLFIWLPLNYGTILPFLLEIYLQLMLSRRLLKLIYFRRRFPANLMFLFSLLRRICIQDFKD